MRIHICPSVCF